jgi:hypothetical protein
LLTFSSCFADSYDGFGFWPCVVIKRHLLSADIGESDADDHCDDNGDGSSDNETPMTGSHNEVVRECTYSVRWDDNTVTVKLPITLLRSRNIKADDDNEDVQNDSDSSDDDAANPATPMPATKKLSKAAQRKIDKMQKLEAIR